MSKPVAGSVWVPSTDTPALLPSDELVCRELPRTLDDCELDDTSELDDELELDEDELLLDDELELDEDELWVGPQVWDRFMTTGLASVAEESPTASRSVSAVAV